MHFHQYLYVDFVDTCVELPQKPCATLFYERYCVFVVALHQYSIVSHNKQLNCLEILTVMIHTLLMANMNLFLTPALAKVGQPPFGLFPIGLPPIGLPLIGLPPFGLGGQLDKPPIAQNRSR